jgi:hypothetical protein
MEKSAMNIDASMYDTTPIFRWHYSPAERQRMRHKARQCMRNFKRAIQRQDWHRTNYWFMLRLRWTEKADRIKR